MTSLAQRLEAATRRGRSITFVSGKVHTPVTWEQLHDEARAVAAALQVRGVAPGDHVAVLGPTSRALVTALQGIWLAGAATVVMPLPLRMGSLEEFVAQTRTRLLDSDARVLLIDPDLAPFYEAKPGDPPSVLLTDVMPGAGGPGSEAFEQLPEDPDHLAILQYTSGSTSEPKGVMIPRHTLLANLDAIAIAAELEPEVDVLVSWLPLYHDMGLVGLLTLSITNGNTLVLAPPQEFLAGPSHWMEWISTYGGTATAGPNFSYVLATRALKRAAPGSLDLSSLRIALNGAEPIDPDQFATFFAAGAPHGLRAEAAFPAFGMAEVAIAGTFPKPLAGMKVDRIDRRVLETERLAVPVDEGTDGSRPLVFLGTAVPGLDVRICDPSSGQELKDREVGELEIRGTSVTPGYYKRPDVNAESFRGEWFRTGDLAYTVGGELVLCGRIKDVIIVGGRNVFPEDVERAVAGVDGVRAGNVIAFGVEGRKGREAVVVVAESKAEDAEPVKHAVHSRVLEATGVPPADVVLVAPGTLPKTSSGKLQRSLCKARYLEERLSPV